MPNSFLGDLTGSSEDILRTRQRYNRLRSESGGTPTSAMLQSDINRDVLPGVKSSWTGELDPVEAAKLDRYTWGTQAGVGGLPTALYSELVKVPAVQEPMKHITKLIGKLTGYPQAEEWYNTNQTSSPPSLRNVSSYLRGALESRIQDIPYDN